jgi:hypothetical protein
VGKNKKIIIYQSVSLDLMLLTLLMERILGSMASDNFPHASSKRHSGATVFGSPRRRVFGQRRVGSATSVTTEDDFRFLRRVGSVIEAQSDLVKRSVATIAESRELLAKVSDLLHR